MYNLMYVLTFKRIIHMRKIKIQDGSEFVQVEQLSSEAAAPKFK